MKLANKILTPVISAVALLLYGQGRGMINRLDREKVITIISSLKPEMTEAEGTRLLENRGLEIDWGAIGTNTIEQWYRFGTANTNIEELCIIFRPRQNMPFDVWQKQHLTNSSFSQALLYKAEKGSLTSIPFTNVPNENARSKSH